MLKKVTFSLEESLIDEFRKYCITENDGIAKPGMYSEQLTKAINLLFDSKKPKDETMDIEGLDLTTPSNADLF